MTRVFFVGSGSLSVRLAPWGRGWGAIPCFSWVGFVVQSCCKAMEAFENTLLLVNLLVTRRKLFFSPKASKELVFLDPRIAKAGGGKHKLEEQNLRKHKTMVC